MHISWILFGSCDHLESWTQEWILILSVRHPILTNTKRPFWSMWSINTAPNIDVCQSRSMNVFCTSISSTVQWLQDTVNHPLIRMICPAMMKNTECLTMWLRRHTDEVIVQHIDWPPRGYIWIHYLTHLQTGAKLIQITMITTPTQWKLAVHFCCQI